jgi:hypothetical protein
MRLYNGRARLWRWQDQSPVENSTKLNRNVELGELLNSLQEPH